MDARDGRGPIDRPKINIVGEPDRARYGFYLNFLAENSVAEFLGSERDPLPIDLLLAARSERGVALISIRERNGKTRIQTPAQLFNIDLQLKLNLIALYPDPSVKVLYKRNIMANKIMKAKLRTFSVEELA